jgi:hypothetical protein
MIDPALSLMIVLGIAALLAVAGGQKLKNLAIFTHTFAAYRLLPDGAARSLAWSIPCAEVGIAAALLWPASRSWAVAGAIGIFLGYAAALALNLARNRRDIDCGCAGPGERRSIAGWMVWRNLVLAASLGAAALPGIARPLTGVDFLTVAGGLAAAIILYGAVDRLLGEVIPRAASLNTGIP